MLNTVQCRIRAAKIFHFIFYACMYINAYFTIRIFLWEHWGLFICFVVGLTEKQNLNKLSGGFFKLNIGIFELDLTWI